MRTSEAKSEFSAKVHREIGETEPKAKVELSDAMTFKS